MVAFVLLARSHPSLCLCVLPLQTGPHPAWLFYCFPSSLDVQCYEMCNAGAVIHSHGMETAMVTMMKPGATEFRVSGL